MINWKQTAYSLYEIAQHYFELGVASSNPDDELEQKYVELLETTGNLLELISVVELIPTENLPESVLLE